MRKSFDQWTHDDFKKLKAEFVKRFGEPLGQGRHRVVFRMTKDWVLKVPTRHSGLAANCDELSFQADGYAITEEEAALSEEFGIPIVKMEYVTHVGWSEKPDWTWSIDGGQVGHTNDGRLVAYDWEHN